MGRTFEAILSLVLVVASVGCCTHHIRLEVPVPEEGSEFTCGVAPKGDGTDPNAINCQPASKSVPEDDNRANTAFVNLPRECKGRFRRIIIHDVTSSNPTVQVMCAAPVNPVTEMPK